jgi:beta-glucosidase
LFGEFSPAGRLPVTFYRGDADLPDFEDYAMKGRTYRYFEGKPLYAFGHGLTYAEFDYRDLKVERSDEGLEASLSVTNTGTVTSDEVVQLYASRPDGHADDPLKWLVGFERVRDIKPAETREVAITIPERWLALWDDEADARTVAPGKLKIDAGPSSDRPVLSTTVDIENTKED